MTHSRRSSLLVYAGLLYSRNCYDIVNVMPRRTFSIVLAVVFVLLSFNAYACLVPLYGGVNVEQGSDCSMPQEKAARQHCDAFKTLGVQAATQIQAEPSLCAYDIPVSVVSPTVAQGSISSHLVATGSSPPFRHDPLDLTRVLRL
jgi:hypothetical protein